MKTSSLLPSTPTPPGSPGRPGSRSGRRLLSGWRYVYRLQSLLSLGCLEGHEGAFFEGLEPATLYPRVVDEKVLTPVVWGDEAVALLVAEPLYRSLGHTLCAHLSLPEPDRWMTDLRVCPPQTRPASSLRVALYSTKTPGFHTNPALLREVRVKERGAIFVDGHRSGLFEGLLVVGAAGEHGNGTYAGFPGSLDVPYRVTDGDGLVSARPGSSQGLLEDVGGRLRVLDGTRVDDAVYAILGFEFLHVMFQLFVFGAGDEPDLVAPLFERGDQLLRSRERMAVLLQLPVELAVEVLDLLYCLLVFHELADQQRCALPDLLVKPGPRHPMGRLLKRPRPRLRVQIVGVHQRAVNVQNDHFHHPDSSRALE